MNEIFYAVLAVWLIVLPASIAGVLWLAHCYLPARHRARALARLRHPSHRFADDWAEFVAHHERDYLP